MLETEHKILIIDDENDSLTFFELMLRPMGFNVHTASSGYEGLELLKKLNPDVILLDSIMPEMDGLTVLRKIRNDDEWQTNKNVPIVFFSDINLLEDKIEAFSLGIDDFIAKPYNFYELVIRLKTVIHRNNQQIDENHILAFIDEQIKLIIEDFDLKNSSKSEEQDLAIRLGDLVKQTRLRLNSNNTKSITINERVKTHLKTLGDKT